jgi:hypothetical protein
MTKSLLDAAKAHVRKAFADLEGPDDDIMPHFLWLGPHGLGLMPLYMMSDDAAKDEIAAAMTASLAVSRATEAMLVSSSWVVAVDPATVDDKLELQRMKHGFPKQRPSEHPDRMEMVALVHSTRAGSRMTHALLTRYPDKPPTLGEWETGELSKLEAGRFDRAAALGLRFVREMPPEMIDIIEEGWADGQQEDLITRFMKVQRDITGRPSTASVTVEPIVEEPEPGQVIEGLFGTQPKEQP